MRARRASTPSSACTWGLGGVSGASLCPLPTHLAGTHSSWVQLDGRSMRCPSFSSLNSSSTGMPGYGEPPRVKISHIRIPKDHLGSHIAKGGQIHPKVLPQLGPLHPAMLCKQGWERVDHPWGICAPLSPQSTPILLMGTYTYNPTVLPCPTPTASSTHTQQTLIPLRTHTSLWWV